MGQQTELMMYNKERGIKMARRGRKIKSTYDKLKDVDPQFLEAMQGMQPEGLKQKIVDLTKYQIETSEAKKNDPDLQKITEMKSVAEESYRSALGAIKLKLKFIVETLQSKGQ